MYLNLIIVRRKINVSFDRRFHLFLKVFERGLALCRNRPHSREGMSN